LGVGFWTDFSVVFLRFFNLLTPAIHMSLEELFLKSDVRKESFGFYVLIPTVHQ
jgi:hypothetical protein